MTKQVSRPDRFNCRPNFSTTTGLARLGGWGTTCFAGDAPSIGGSQESNPVKLSPVATDQAIPGSRPLAADMLKRHQGCNGFVQPQPSFLLKFRNSFGDLLRRQAELFGQGIEGDDDLAVECIRIEG